MAKDPKEEEHVEELLSQLQGIFGKLSNSEAEEARAKAAPPIPPAPAPVPVPVQAPAPLPPPSTPIIPPAEPAPAVMPPLDPFSLQPPPELEMAPPILEAPAFEPPPIPPPPSPPPPEPLEPPGPVMTPPPLPTLEVNVAPVVLDASTIGCAIYYPPTREKEAKTLAQKIETMTPKFTKVAFKLKIVCIVAYDPRSEWREAALQRAQQDYTRALFLLSERLMEETKRRAAQMDCEAHHIYFQEVPVLSLEKKAFFTDVLLGMVFFFDTLKPKSTGE